MSERYTRSTQGQRMARLSRLAARVLRHKPDEVGVTLDAAGFAPLDALASALADQPGWASLTADDLVALARADPRRYEVQDGRIRARYGHTVPVEQPGEPALPPEWLYCGMSAADAAGAAMVGLHPSGRQHVHLSTTAQAALDVGRRHAADAVVVVVFARRAAATGVAFWRASPMLFLTPAVPAEHLQAPALEAQRDPPA